MKAAARVTTDEELDTLAALAAEYEGGRAPDATLDAIASAMRIKAPPPYSAAQAGAIGLLLTSLVEAHRRNRLEEGREIGRILRALEEMSESGTHRIANVVFLDEYREQVEVERVSESVFGVADPSSAEAFWADIAHASDAVIRVAFRAERMMPKAEDRAEARSIRQGAQELSEACRRRTKVDE